MTTMILQNKGERRLFIERDRHDHRIVDTHHLGIRTVVVHARLADSHGKRVTIHTVLR